MVTDDKEARLIADAGVGRQLREHIRKDSNLYSWAGEIALLDDLSCLNELYVMWDSWRHKGRVTGEIEGHPVLGKVVRSIRSRNVNESIQKKTTELGMLTSLMGVEDYGISGMALGSFPSNSGENDPLAYFLLSELDNPYCTILIRGKPGSGKTDLALLLIQFYRARRKVLIASNMESFVSQDMFLRSKSELVSWLNANLEKNKIVLLDEASSWYNARKFTKVESWEFGELVRKVRKRRGKLILIGHREKDIDIDYRELCTLEIEKYDHRNPTRAIVYVDGREIYVNDIPATLLEFDTYDMGDFDLSE